MRDDVLRQLLGIFREEAREHLDTLSRLMRELGADSVSVERLDEAMRTAHTLKGAAAMVGIDAIASRAHDLEDRFLEWKEAPSTFDLERARAAVDDLYQQVDLQEAGCSTEPTLATDTFAPTDVLDIAVDLSPPLVTAKGPMVVQPPAETTEPERARQNSTVRIPIERLDAVQAHLAELIETRSELTVLMERQRAMREAICSFLMDERLDRSPKGKSLLQAMDSLEWPEHNTALHFEQATGQLRESVRKLRLVPWGLLTAALERTVRATAATLGKEANLQLVAPETEIDKSVLDALRDPLIHVLRNAVDHGIETKSLRRTKGKLPIGRIRVSTSFDDRGVTVLVEDDGAGIDFAALRRTASACADGTEPTRGELLEQIFEPGRSTADHVTSISGRGVGLDLARRNLQASGGTITVIPQGELGGATFRLWVPVNMSFGSALLVRAGDVCFSIGLEYVERILRLPATRVGCASGRLLLHVEEGDPLPLLRLDELFGTGAAAAAAALGRDLTIVMLIDDDRRLPLLVDSIVDSRELLLLPLPWNLNGLTLLRGCSVLPDGSVALAVNPSALFQNRNLGARASGVAAPKSLNKRILVADDSHTARAMAKSALLSAGYEVELAVDGLDAWNLLEHGDFVVLVTDVQMPNLDGFELTRRVRADSRFARLPVILVTTRSTRDDIERGLSLGADEYVVKGALQREKLIEAVRRHA